MNYAGMGMLKHIKLLAGDSLFYGLMGVMSPLIGFLLIPVYTRMLLPADYGIMAVVGTTSQVLKIALFMGFGGVVMRYYFDYLKDPEGWKGFMGSIFLFQNLTGLLVCALMVAFSKPLSGFIFADPSLSVYLVLAVVQVFLTLSTIIPTQMYIIRREKGLYMSVLLLGLVLGAAIPVYLVVVKRQGVMGVFLGGAIAQAVSWVVFTCLVLREIRPSFNLSHIKTALIYGTPLVPHLLTHWVMNYADRLMLQRMLGAAEAGIYSLGYNFGFVMMLVVGSFNTAWAPWFNRENTEDEEEAKKKVTRIFTYYVFGVGMCFLLVSGFGKEAILIMADPKFHSGYMVVPVIALTYVFMGLYFMAVNPIFYKKKTGYLPFLSAAAAVVNIGLNLVMIPRWGMMGAAWASLFSFAALYALVYSVSRRLYPIRYEHRRIFIIALVLALAFAAVLVAGRYPMTLSIPLKALVALMVPVMMGLMGFYNQGEKQYLRELTGRVFGGRA